MEAIVGNRQVFNVCKLRRNKLSNLQAYQRLARLNLTLTHKSLSRLVSTIGENHDKEVLEWRNAFIPLLMEVCKLIIALFLP